VGGATAKGASNGHGSFAHLHTHTEFSMLDGAARVTDAVAAAVADGQPALGITDHGNMYGVLDFYKECRAQGVTPVIGMEAYMAAESRHERPTPRGRVDDMGGEVEGGRKLWYHLTLLAETNEGYRNLMRLASLAYLEGYHRKPRLDWELLEAHHQGIIATTGCLGGVVPQALVHDDQPRAKSLAGRLQDIFGPENLFVELQDHGLADQRRINPLLVGMARDLGAPLLATNDSHYTHRADHVAHDALLCVQTGSTIDDPRRFKFEGEEHYLKTADEMRALFAEVPEACDNTLWVAERAAVEIELGKPKLPEFPVPDAFQSATGSYEEAAAAYLRHLTLEGASQRYGPKPTTVVRERLDFELGVIADMGFSAYFLIVWDLIRHARQSGIRVGPGRGSAAGCCVAYCLRIVDIDPIRHDLLFERFLNPGRLQMPDIDMDFDERYRGEMIRYATARYGWDHVAQIVTFSTIKARAAVRDAARVLGYPYGLGDRIAKAMPPLVMGRDTSLSACFEVAEGSEDGYRAASDLRAMYDTDPEAHRVIDVARGLEGLRRQDSIHAAAVVITQEPLMEHLPIQRKPESGMAPEDAPIVTQYEMHGVEELGLLKMDFLGLRNLSVIERALDVIQATTGERPDIDSIPLDDEKTFAMLKRGDSMGVFQLEGRPMRATMRSLAPSCFDDVAALVALYRPGPMAANMHNEYPERKNGRRPVTYLHPDLEPLLGDTYGLMLYQESVMRVAQRFAGYSLAEADNLRKACGKKNRILIAAERAKFVAGCDHAGYGTELGTVLFDIIEPFADYAFNKSHSYGYGLVAYQTAWLKANHPVEYLAALLTSVKDDKDKTAAYLSECRALGITVLVPDANLSVAEFTARPGEDGEGASIPFGLATVRNVGESLVRLIVAERDGGGPFRSFWDFCERVDYGVLNKRTMESLIKAGAFDSLGHPRLGLCLVLDQVIDATVARRRKSDMGIMSLFSFSEDPEGAGDEGGAKPNFDDIRVPVPEVEFDKAQLLAFEKEMLGLYVSDHPLLGAGAALRRHTECSIAELREASPGEGRRDGEVRVVGGVVTALTRKHTKKGDLMATFTLEDLESQIEVFVFPRVMQSCGELLTDDAIVCVKARLDAREDPPKLVALDLTLPDLTEPGSKPLGVRIPPGCTDSTVDRLKAILMAHPGPTPVDLTVGDKVLRLPVDISVEARPGLLAELRVLLGPQGIVP